MRSSRKVSAGFFLTLALLLLPAGYSSAAQLFDPGFGQRGRVAANVSMLEVSRSGSVTDLHTLANGKLKVAVKPGGDRDPVSMVRLDPVGAPDLAYGNGGIRRAPGSFAVESAKRTIVAGTVGSGAPKQDLLLRRFKPNGNLDRSFGKKGSLRIDFGAEDYPGQVVIGSTGQILVSALTNCHATQRACGGYSWGGFGLALLGSNGNLIRKTSEDEGDRWFGIVAADDGTYRATNSSSWDQETRSSGLFRIDRQLKISTIREHPDSPDWFGPVTMLSGNGFLAFARDDEDTEEIIRVKSDGTVDPGFTSTGCPRSDSGGSSNKQIRIDAEGRILALGLYGCGLIRVLPDGGADPSFGVDGVVDLSDPEGERPVSIMQPTADSGVVLAGWDYRGGRLRVIRLTPSGTRDSTFPTRYLSIAQPSADVARSVIRTGNGYLVAGHSSCYGYEDVAEGCRGFFLAKYGKNGKPNRSFGKRGVIRDGFMRINAIARTPDGRLIAAGSTDRVTGPWSSPQTEFALARFTAGGRLDKSFGDEGLTVARIPGNLHDAQALALRVARDGRILATGETTDKKRGVSLALPVLRFHPNGTPDGSFGKDGLAMIGPNRLGDGNAIALAGKRILIATRDGFRKPAIVSLTKNGRLDRSFGRGGIATPRLAVRSRLRKGTRFKPFREARALRVLKGGRVIATADDGYGLQDGAVFRLRADGKADRSFGRKGAIYTGGLASRSIATDRCGRFILSGLFRASPHFGRSFGVTIVGRNGGTYRPLGKQRIAFPFRRQLPSWATASVSRNSGAVVVGSVKRSLTAEDLAIAAVKTPRKCR